MHTIKHFVLITVICLAVSLTGCMNYRSSVDARAVPQSTSVLVVSRLPVTPPKTAAEFSLAFSQPYKVCVINTGLLTFANADSLIRQTALNCKSEVVLTVDYQTMYPTKQGRRLTKARELYLEMTRLSDGKPFWKAVSLGRGSLDPSDVAALLQKDGIIKGSAIPKQPY
jgi:hypothetical protein